MVTTENPESFRGQRGVVRWAARYDLLIWLLTLGREKAFREKLLIPARLTAGESVLDVGCGTGSLALAAKRQVGEGGSVSGIDASPEMIERARIKARKAGIEGTFEIASADALPFSDARFDVVLSTVMLHHLPRAMRSAAVREMKRVLKPGGRVLLVDFAGARDGKGPLMHFHRHGHVEPRALMELASDAGLRVADSGPVGKWRLHFVVAKKTA
jgi:ubiquinone/menaquinone biosynthesis C-methylase UbiE